MPLEKPKRPLGPEDKTRVGRALAALLSVGLVSLSALGAFVVWHLVRRGRLIRESLGPPRRISLPDPEELRRDAPSSTP